MVQTTIQALPVTVSYIYRDGDRSVEIAASNERDALSQLPAIVARRFPQEGADYWQAFTYCGTMPAQATKQRVTVQCRDLQAGDVIRTETGDVLTVAGNDVFGSACIVALTDGTETAPMPAGMSVTVERAL